MGWFTKKSTEPDEADEALPFLSVTAANEVRRLVRAAFAELGVEVVVHADHAVDDAGREFGFWNVATRCAESDRDTWRAVVRDHVERVLPSLDAPDPFNGLSADDAAARTYVRTYAAEDFPLLDACPHREFVPGVVEILALDLPETVAFYDHHQAQRLGGWHALHEAGLGNLRTLPVEQFESLEAPGGGEFHVLAGPSVYTASQAVLLPDLATRLTAEQPTQHGWLMSMPNRHQVAWHLIRDHTVVNAVNGMARFTLLGHSDGAGPVSRHLYWWNGSSYEQLTRMTDAGTLAVEASPEFTAMVESLVADPA